MRWFFFLVFLFATSCNVLASDKVEQFEQQVKQYRGKVVLVDFWASWCIPCKASFPWLNKIQAQYADQGFTVLSVNLDADKRNADDFLQHFPASFPVFYDAKGKVARAFKIKGMPSSILIDREGKVISRHVGFNDEKKIKYQQEIEVALR